MCTCKINVTSNLPIFENNNSKSLHTRPKCNECVHVTYISEVQSFHSMKSSLFFYFLSSQLPKDYFEEKSFIVIMFLAK